MRAKQGRHRRKIAIGPLITLALVIVIVVLLWCIVIGVRELCTMQTDTMDQIMEIRAELDQIELVPHEAEKTSHGQNMSLTADERDLVERVVAAEARGEEYPGMAAVAQTIRDRAVQWDMSPSEVVLAPYQYASPYQGIINDDVKQAVSEVFDEGLRVWQEPVMWFHESGITPYWSDRVVEVEKIGNHVFYRKGD